MTSCKTMLFSVPLLIFVSVFSMSSIYVYAHGDDREDNRVPVITIDQNDPQQVEKLKQLIVTLTQLIDLLKKNAELADSATNEVEHHDEEDVAELKIWVEVHSYKTHAHVQRLGMKEQSWLLENLEYTEEEEIIAAIAEKSGLTEHEIEKVIVFPSGELDSKGDSVEEYDEEADQDVSGIHIMGDGKVMWGNGTEVHDATITNDGKIKLSNGKVIVPKFDLR